MSFEKSISCRIIKFFSLKHVFLLGFASVCYAESRQPFQNFPKGFSTPFSKDVALVDRFTQKKSPIKVSKNKPEMDLSFGRPITEEKVGAFLYKAFDNPKKFAQQATATTIFTGLDAMGLSEPVKKSVDYIKDKTQFKFGSCGKVQISSQVKAESCLSEESSIELQSDYNLNSVTLNFKWSL
ncbi:hypothetical protein [Endozoicomonas sp. Mp262]|uniref:hypothetical protein n=1 Tax=Endozoicomonas sp. Mp262 TaxID=2919499 RepID=UPI0021E0A238